jgi:heptosyltransferase-2
LAPFERIVVRCPNWLGDALMARPLLHALRAAHPAARLHAVGPGAVLALIEGERLFDASHDWPPARAAGAGVTRRRIEDQMRDFRPQLAMVLPPSFSSAWQAWRWGATVRVGFRHDARGAILTHALRRPARGDLHLSREYLALGAAVGVSPVALPVLPIPAAATAQVTAVLEREEFDGHPLVVLGPGAIYGPAKRWDAGRFGALGRTLAARGWRVLVCGAASERDTCGDVARRIGAGGVSLAGTIDLPTQAALCQRARLTVCNDSGLAHVAAAVGSATIALFGSTSSAWTAPLGPRVRIIQHAPVCSPCFQRRCRIGTICLTSIGVDEVARACEEMAA